MKRTYQTMTTLLVSLAFAATGLASEATTSATAGSNGLFRNGTAGATANYQGRLGFARTQADSGAINRSRGVAVGVDRDGISLSVSNAIAPRFGPALATNFNMTIGANGEVARSSGMSVANGPLRRSATAAGSSGVRNGIPTATATADGRTDRFGRVNTNVQSRTSRGAIRRAPARFGSQPVYRTSGRRVVLRR